MLLAFEPRLTVQQQCELLGVPRSTYYYQPQPESAETLHLLRKLDELYTARSARTPARLGQ
jgi:putative transposase